MNERAVAKQLLKIASKLMHKKAEPKSLGELLHLVTSYAEAICDQLTKETAHKQLPKLMQQAKNAVHWLEAAKDHIEMDAPYANIGMQSYEPAQISDNIQDNVKRFTECMDTLMEAVDHAKLSQHTKVSDYLREADQCVRNVQVKLMGK